MSLAQMADEVFSGVKVKPAGKVYQTLISTFPLVEIKTKSEHKVALDVITRVMDYLDSHSGHAKSFVSQVESYLGTLATLVEKYEKEAFTLESKASGAEVLEYLMDSRGLTQDDLAQEVGGQSVVSQILKGKRELNVRQIKALARRFHVSPAVFLSDGEMLDVK